MIVMTYNMSWETQTNLNSNTHTNACKEKYKRISKCTEIAIQNMKSIQKLDLLLLQEVEINLEQKIMKIQKNLDNSDDYSYLRILWNSKIFGDIVYKFGYNIAEFVNIKEIRPIFFILFENEYLVINLHAFHGYNKNKVLKIIIEHIILKFLPKKFRNLCIKSIKSHRVIIGGDFNDEFHSIHHSRPLNIFDETFNHGLKKKDMNLISSCCYPYMRANDYILSKNINNIYIPEVYKNKLGSDHYPVIAEINPN